MRGNGFKKFLIVLLIFIGLAAILRFVGKRFAGDDKAVIAKNSILHMELNSPIWNGKRFLKTLKDNREDKEIKAILIEIDSPGGAVGPSQEIYTEIKRTREEFKKPVVCVTTGVMASGAYYAAVGCDKIVTAAGSMIGSIGVIMEFANLEKLYDWAKVSRYTITSGKFKDSGSEYRAMREDERALFQDMINEVYQQFRTTVMEGRNLKAETMDQYADGRVFTGTKAVELGFADKVGTFEDAVKLTAEIAGLGEDYQVYEIPKKKRSIFDIGSARDDDNVNSLARESALIDRLIFQVLGISESRVLGRLNGGATNTNQPLYMLPGAIGL